MKPTIIIPAYNPDNRLFKLVKQLKSLGFDHIIIVDDGSDTEKKSIFEVLEKVYLCTLIKHETNQGKGAALKSGMKKALELFPKNVGCVSADADGQHAPDDIALVAQTLMKFPYDLILGARNFTGKEIPFKSKWGNRITSVVFKIATGVTCSDTQTGLRGIPTYVMPELVRIPGDRFEYEMSTLMEQAKKDVEFTEVVIKTLYFDDNKGTHFNPVIDSLKIYFNIIKYSFAALSSAIIDLCFFALMMAYVSFGAFGATVIARIISGFYNFTINRHFVFKSDGNATAEGIKYATLFLIQMFSSAICVDILTSADASAVPAKLFIDGSLFIASYFIQKKFVFKHRASAHVKER